MVDVFFDESGYTGKALLSPVQPRFVIASSIIGEDESGRLLADAFPRFQGQEFKFQEVWRREGSRRRLAHLCENIGTRAQDVYVWQIDKKFCVLTKMIDFLIEPVAHRAGYDFYKNAHAYRYSNYVHFGLNHIGSPELYDATVNAYYEFARDPSEATLERLRFRLAVMAKSVPDDVRFFFSTALVGAQIFHHHSDIDTFKSTMEIYVTSMLNCVSYWANGIKGDLDLYHDQSNSFFAQKVLWDALMSKDVDEQLHPVANGPPIRFPLPVRSTNSLNSKASSAVQLCDLIAGVTAKFASHKDGDPGADILDAILRTGFAEVPTNGVTPALDFPEGGPEPLDGPDPVDRMSHIIRQGGGYSAAKRREGSG